MIPLQFNSRGRSAIAQWPVFLFAALSCYITLSGFSCTEQEEIHVPPSAGVESEGFNVGHSFGHPSHDANEPGVGDPCKVFTGGVYRIKKIVVEVFKLDANGNEVPIYPTRVYKDGVNFANGNPNSPISPGMGFKIPFKGAFKVRTRVYGYPCDELPNPTQCLHCCEGDPSAAPFWEETSGWHDAKTDKFPSGYISYPKFRYCI